VQVVEVPIYQWAADFVKIDGGDALYSVLRKLVGFSNLRQGAKIKGREYT